MPDSHSLTPIDANYAALNCLNCGETLIGRRDKKFCNDHCRSCYHNILNAPRYNLVRNTHAILRKNRRILFQAIGIFHEYDTIPVHWLVQRGFSFQHCTQRIEQNNQLQIIVCYDISYHWIDSEGIQISYISIDWRAA